MRHGCFLYLTVIHENTAQKKYSSLIHDNIKVRHHSKKARELLDRILYTETRLNCQNQNYPLWTLRF